MEMTKRSDKLTFGKYQGKKTVGELVNDNPKYLIWCDEHTPHHLSPKLREACINRINVINFAYEVDDDLEDCFYDAFDYRFWD